MIGLEFVLNLFDMKHNELAEQLGIKKQNINLWIKGKQGIPLKYLPMLSGIFKVSEEYFQKELSEVDKLELQKNKLKEDLKPVIVGYDTHLILGVNADLVQTPIYSSTEINEMETEIEKAKLLEKFKGVVSSANFEAEIIFLNQIIMLLENHRENRIFKNTMEALSHYFNVLPNWVGEPENENFTHEFFSFLKAFE